MFITKACQQDCYDNDGEYYVRVVSVIVEEFLEERVVKVHLYKHGFKPNY